MASENERVIETNMDWLHYVCEQYKFGNDLYELFANKISSMDEKTEMIISPANLGDTVFIASLAEAYKRAHDVKKLIIVAKERQAEAVEWFSGIDGILPMSNEEIYALRYYFTISGNFYSNGIRYGHIPCVLSPEYPGMFLHKKPGFNGDTLKHIWEKRILDIPEDSCTSELIVPKNIIHSPDNYEKYKNAVLIAPAAFTNKGIPERFWELLTEKLMSLGYEVYNNSGGLDYDKIIKGTIPFCANTKELILNAPLFKHVVAVRSGFTDLVTKTSASMSVIHPSDKPDIELRIEYGVDASDVRDLGRVKDIYPIYYVGGREQEIIDLIIEDIPK